MATDKKRTSKRPAKAAAKSKRPVPAAAPKRKAAKRKAATRKPKVVVSAWDSVDNRDVVLDAFFDTMVEEVSKDSGRDDIVAADVAERILICLPFQHLCWKYLFCSQGYPLGRLMHLFGPQGSCKSALATEILRWHLMADGLGVVIENENKDTPDLRRSILQEKRFLSRCRTHPTGSMDGETGWQAANTFWVQKAKDKAVGTVAMPGPGRVIPYCFVVDSVMGTATMDELKKIADSGSAGRGQFGVGANILSNYCRAMPGMLRQEPFSAVWVNHQKSTKDEMGRPSYNTPGGKSVGFYASMELEVKRTKYIKLANSGGVTIAFRVRKNCVGETGRRMNASMLWQWVETSEGNWQQQTFWDWYTTTAELLVGLKTGGSAQLKKDLASVCDIMTAKGRSLYSKRLGIPKDKPVSYHEFGKKLESRLDVVAELEPLLGVASRPLYVPRVDFGQQVSEGISLGEEAAAAMYNTELMMPEGAVALGSALSAAAEGHTFDELGSGKETDYGGLDTDDE
jgi:RecA/RadA recombinase